VSRRQVEDKVGRGLFFYHPSLGETLKLAYPDYPWELARFPRSQVVKDEAYIDRALAEAETKLGITKVIYLSLLIMINIKFALTSPRIGIL